VTRLKNEGVSDDEIVDLVLEGFWGDLFDPKQIFGGAQEAAKAKLAEGIIDVILKVLGLEPTGTFGKFSRNLGIQIAENFKWLQWRSYFGSEACELWTDVVEEALLEAVVFEPILDAVAQGLGILPTGQAAARPTVAGTMSTQNLLGGLVYTSIRESVTETLKEHLPYRLGAVLCKIEARDMVALVAGTTPELRGVRAELEKQVGPKASVQSTSQRLSTQAT
jgi:hypothetical protein